MSGSRYDHNPLLTWDIGEGKIIEILSPRVLPPSQDLNDPQIQYVECLRHEALDSVAERLWNDSTQYWRLMDATSELHTRNVQFPIENSEQKVEMPKLILPKDY